MNGNFRIEEHRLRYMVRCVTREAERFARGFWEGFGKPVLIVALGVALSSPLTKMAAIVLATLTE